MVDALRSSKVVELIVDGSIASLNVTVGLTVRATPVALFAGDTALTVGAVVSGTVPAVTVMPAPGASRLPLSSTARVRIVNVPLDGGVQT